MNKSYRSVWSAARGAYIVAHENASTRGKPSSTRKAVVAAVASALLGLGGQALAATDCLTPGAITIDGAATANCALTTGDDLTVSGTGSISDASVAVTVDNGTAAGSITVLAGGAIVGGASGIVIGDTLLGAATLTGGITNAGLIEGTSYSAIAVIGVQGTGTPSTVGGAIYNQSGGQLVGGTVALYVTSSTIGGGITNAGTIASPDTAILVERSGVAGSVFNSGTISSTAGDAYGVQLGVVSITGDIRNEGLIDGGVSLNDVVAGKMINTGTVTAPNAYNATVKVSGGELTGITNSGTASTIMAQPTDATPYGLRIDSSAVINGSILNQGRIFAEFSGSSGEAYGIAVIDSSTVTGAITNAGTITALANASGSSALAYGIFAENAVVGSIVNGGTITVSGVADGSTGSAFGIYAKYSVLGSVSNSGTISVFADGTDASSALGIGLEGVSLTGSIVNSGRIISNDVGIEVYDSTIDQGITNSGLGVIVADVYGVNINSATIGGGITNSGLVSVSGQAGIAMLITNQSSVTGNLFNGGTLSGGGVGVQINGSSLVDGLITNSGMITITGTDGRAINVASGSSVAGGIVNSGTIKAPGHAIEVTWGSGIGETGGVSIRNSGLIQSSDASWGDEAGIQVRSGSALAGSIVNESGGRIIGYQRGINVASSSTVAGGITNGGTISGGNYAIKSDSSSSLPNILNQSGGVINGPMEILSTTDVTNNGLWIMPEDPFNPGTYVASTISGNFTQGSTGTLRIGAYDTSNYSKLTVGGDVSLDGSLYVDVKAGSPLVTGDALNDIITATGTVTGTFSAIDTNSTLFAFEAIYNANDVDLDLVAASVDEAGDSNSFANAVQSTGNNPASGAADVFDDLVDRVASTGSTGNQAMDDILATLDAMSTEEEKSNALSQVLPLLTGGATVAMGNAMHGLNRIIQARQQGAHGRSTGDEFYGDGRMWMKPFGSWANQDDRKGVSGFDADTYGMVFGADAAVAEVNRLGFALAYARSDVDSNSNVAPNSADVDTYQAVIYGSRSLSDATEVNFQADVGYHKTEGERSVNLLLPGRVAKSDFDSWSFHIGAGLAHTLALSDKTSITPSVRADYARIDSEDYDEKGAPGLNLEVNDTTVEELILSVDAKLAHRLTDRATVTANMGVGYDAINEDASMTSAFAGTPGTAFTTRGLEPDAWSYRGGLGVVGNVTEALEVTARYDFELKEDFDNQTASVKFRWAF